MPLRIWNTLCSLKLAVVLASAATAVIMGGSLLMPGRPGLFGAMDRQLLGEWFSGPAAMRLGETWWVYLAAVLILGLGVNALCCFLDWLAHLRQRWRKTGEYLIHLGFVLVLAAYAWGSVSGFRGEEIKVRAGETVALPGMPGHYLRLEGFEPRVGAGGRPLDMINRLVLLQGERELRRETVRINHPLTWKGVSVLAASFGEEATGFRFLAGGAKEIDLGPGSELTLEGGGRLRVLAFHPDVVVRPDGRVVPGGPDLRNPAFALELTTDKETWRGWYLLRQGLPPRLSSAGLQLRPLEPVGRTYSLLSVNLDPGASMALAGGLLLGAGSILALFSYYAKRSRRDRPELD